MSNLKKNLIRLAHSNPELRPHLLPLIKSASDRDTEAMKMLQQAAAHFKRKGLEAEIERDGNAMGDGPSLSIWRKHYEDSGSFGADWSGEDDTFQIWHHSGSRHSAGHDIGWVNLSSLLREIEKYGKKYGHL